MSVAEKFEVIADEVYKKGRQNEWSDFWDIFQENGKRTDYLQAFLGFDDSIFRPKYDIKPVIATNLFKNSPITNLKELLDNCGVKLDTSNCTAGNYMFLSCYEMTHIPELNLAKCTALTNMFSNDTKIETIDKMILSTSGTTTFSGTFNANSGLTNITFDGVIGQNISFANSPLLADASLENIAQHLKDFLPEWKEGDGNKAIITLHATVKERIKNTEIENLIKSKKWGIA